MIFVKFILISISFNYAVNGQFYFNCDDNPCQHGTCIDLYRKTAYQCDCDPGWDGENCDNSLNPTAVEEKPQEIGDNSKVSDTNNNDYDVNVKLEPEKSTEKPRKNNPCGGECKNGGFCNEITKYCECPKRFNGEFCQYSTLDSNPVHKNLEQCEKRCVNKDDKPGSSCNYKDDRQQQKTCKCGILKVNKDSGYCLPILDSYELCQNDCEFKTNFKMNETRICNYFDDMNKIKTCKCKDYKYWCDDGNFDEGFSIFGMITKLIKGLFNIFSGDMLWLLLLGFLYCIGHPIAMKAKRSWNNRNTSTNRQSTVIVEPCNEDANDNNANHSLNAESIPMTVVPKEENERK